MRSSSSTADGRSAPTPPADRDHASIPAPTARSDRAWTTRYRSNDERTTLTSPAGGWAHDCRCSRVISPVLKWTVRASADRAGTGCCNRCRRRACDERAARAPPNRPTQQRAAGRTGAPRQLPCREAGVSPCASARRLQQASRERRRRRPHRGERGSRCLPRRFMPACSMAWQRAMSASIPRVGRAANWCWNPEMPDRVAGFG